LTPPAVQFQEVEQNFPNPVGGGTLRVLDSISFTVEPTRFTAVVGPSGCGKSTLLQMAAGLLFPSSGSVRHQGTQVTSVNSAVGFVPQRWHRGLSLSDIALGHAMIEKAARLGIGQRLRFS